MFAGSNGSFYNRRGKEEEEGARWIENEREALFNSAQYYTAQREFDYR